MIPQDFLELLRCPLSPSEVRLEQVEDGLVCQRCRLKFPVKDGIPSLRVEAAALPPGCASLEDLPCQRAPAETHP
jgi:uncharacterized protein YbaR (Trm112 family)